MPEDKTPKDEKPKPKITMQQRRRYNAYVKKTLRDGGTPIDMKDWLKIHTQ